jgi:hypothetical protein
MPGHLYCSRCDDHVRAIRPWRGWPFAWRAWWVGLALIACVLPFMILDFCFTQPTVMLYLTAGGLIRAFAREKPVCSTCSLELDVQVRGGTGVRVKPLLRTRSRSENARA